MKLRFDEGTIGAWGGLDGGVGEARQNLVEAVASIEAVLGLREIAWDVAGGDGVEGPAQAGFEVAEQGVEPAEGGIVGSALASLAGIDGAGAGDVVDMAGGGQRGEAGPSVGVDDAAWNKVAFGPLADCWAGEISDARELEAVRFAVGGDLHGGQERRLARRAAAGGAVGAGAADVGVVEVDGAIERGAGVAFNHHLHQLVMEHPGGVVGNAEAARQFERRDAVFALAEMVHRPEPLGQGQLRGVEDATGQRHLTAAGGTLEQAPALDLGIDIALTLWAFETARPAPGKQNAAALLLGSKELNKLTLAHPLLKLHLVLGHTYSPANVIPNYTPI